MQFGRCFEEFEIGAIYKHWPGRTITEYDDTLFCMLTMNHHPLHIDANYAEGTQFKQRLVVGTLVFSIALGMSVEDVSGKAIANLEFENVKHIGPTFHGDTIYAETKVLDKKLSSSKPDRGIVTVETIAYNQRGETVLSFKRRVMVPTLASDAIQQRAWEEKTERRRKSTQL
ncbi:MAG TPA: MaoC family dehydratase [Ktedonosporobacter sp.]|jgi:acyl dehydratase|nr:MaoC family dehydratase [Ktedonosporobacter sp.]